MGRTYSRRVKKALPNDDIEEKVLKGKEKLRAALQENVLPELLWDALLLPSDIDVIAKNASTIDAEFGKGTAKLKQDALHVVHDVTAWKEAESIRDPMHPQAQIITLAALEVLFLLEQKVLPKEAVQELSRIWITIMDHFGLWKIRYRLEDESFLLLDPKEADLVTSLIRKKTRQHAKLFRDIQSIVDHFFQREGLVNYHLVFRKKNLYGVYQKMRVKQKNINHINDLFGIRIITTSLEDCTRARDILHHIWPPHQHLQKDYITSPKANGYQSIHTTVHCLQGEPVEFQIRTEEMDRIAKFGPASHALYKKQARTLS